MCQSPGARPRGYADVITWILAVLEASGSALLAVPAPSIAEGAESHGAGGVHLQPRRKAAEPLAGRLFLLQEAQRVAS